MTKMADEFLVQVTAGPSYDPTTHTIAKVNDPSSTHISSPHCTANVNVRIQNFRGLPKGSPPTSPYFSIPPHHHDQYSIAFTFIPHAPVSGSALVFGNDFDSPIRNHLPPGFQSALHIVKWAIDPGLDGDVYADKPYLYGKLLSSVNILRVGEKAERSGGGEYRIPLEVNEDGIGIWEGADGDEGLAWRKARGCPDGAAERKKWGLKEGSGAWTWEEGRVYRGDFFNPYLDFNTFELKLPGFALSVLGHMGEQDSLRYVLKNKETGDVFFVVVFTLVPKENVEKDDTEQAAGKGDSGHGDRALEDADDRGNKKEYEPKDSDVD